MKTVKNSLMVMSGKGGVGKTTISVNLALALTMDGMDVGILDADITGPNVPKMLNIEGEMPYADNNKRIIPVYIPIGSDNGIKVMSMAFMIEKDSPVIWRGPLKMRAIKQFIEDVDWGNLDYLIIDLPPGTGDEPLSVAQLIHADGAIIVTTPQDVALLDSRKAVNMAKMLKIPVVGIIENMSCLICPKCGERIEVFKSGGGARAAFELKVPFLGRIPIDPMVCKSSDAGKPFILEHNSNATKSFEKIAEKIKNFKIKGSDIDDSTTKV